MPFVLPRRRFYETEVQNRRRIEAQHAFLLGPRLPGKRRRQQQRNCRQRFFFLLRGVGLRRGTAMQPCSEEGPGGQEERYVSQESHGKKSVAEKNVLYDSESQGAVAGSTFDLHNTARFHAREY